MTPVITLENITLRYGRHVALHAINGVFHHGSLTAVAGPNGSGKSTLLKAIAGILKPSAGRVVFNEPRSMAYLPQSSAVARDFPMPVHQAVATGFWAAAGLSEAISAARKKQISAALADVGLAGFEDRQIAQLSGGEFQRMLFARIIVQDAKVILLDEPFTAVDAETTARLMQLLLKWHRENRTIICVLHDLLLIRKYFPDSFVLAGKCLGAGHTHDLFEQKLLSFDLDMAELCAGDAAGHEGHEHHHHAHDHPEHRH